MLGELPSLMELLERRICLIKSDDCLFTGRIAHLAYSNVSSIEQVNSWLIDLMERFISDIEE